MKLIAIHEIRANNAAATKQGVIAPGTPFEMEGDEAERMIELGAAKKATASEVKEAKAEIAATEAASTGENVPAEATAGDLKKKVAGKQEVDEPDEDDDSEEETEEDDIDEEIDLDAMSKAELVSFAKENLDLELDVSDKKAVLLAAVEEGLEKAKK